MTVGPPLEPDAPDARDLLLDELSDPAYAESSPTWFDLVSQAIYEWFANLRLVEGGAPPTLLFIILGSLIAVVLIIVLLVYGVPRIRARSRVSDELFGELDSRTAKRLRRDAEKAATAEDWPVAIAERFRAIARALDERTIVAVLPGTTGHGFSRTAGQAFPTYAAELSAAADAFDEVRYLGRPGNPEAYAQVRALDEALAAAPSPALQNRSTQALGAPR